MSNKMNKLVLLSALMIAIIGTFGTVSAEEYPLIAAGGNEESGFPVGVINVTNDGNNLIVVFSITEDGWELTETHLHVAASEAGIPQTKNGNPRPGQFDYSSSTVHEYTVPIPDGCDEGGNVTIAAHAVVQSEVVVDGLITYIEESAWSNKNPFSGRNWAMYSNYTLPIA